MTRTVTRADLAQAAYLASHLELADVRRLVDDLLGRAADELVLGAGRVKITNFGNFVVVRRPPGGIGRNPKRPEELHAIPASSRVVFRCSRELRARVNGEKPHG